MNAFKLKQAKTARGRREIKRRLPKAFENPKITLFLKANKCSALITEVLKDMSALRKPHSIMFTRKNDIRIFEDETALLVLCQKTDASLFVLGSHSKHKPHRLTFGRMFDFQLLDAIEFAVTDYMPLHTFAGAKPRLGSKPVLMFQGELFESNEVLAQTKTMLLDHFKVSDLKAVDLAGLDNVMVFSAATETLIHVRHYVFDFKKSGTRVPRVELTEVGPSLNLTITRHRAADPTLLKAALWKPDEARRKAKKNEEHSLTAKLGRIHMERQDLSKMTTRKVKGLKRKRSESESCGAATSDGASSGAASSSGRGGGSRAGSSSGPAFMEVDD